MAEYISKLGIDRFQFEYCSELLWGTIHDRKWAEESPLFLHNYKNLLKNYDPIKEREWQKKLKSYIDNRPYKYLYENGVGIYVYESE